jgi:cysteine-rich repeat protein
MPVVSASERYIAFRTRASLVAGDTNGDFDIYLLDTTTSTVTRESLGNVGQQGAPSFEGASLPSMSADARYVAFTSYASNLVPIDPNHNSDVFVRDRCISAGVPVPGCTPTTELVSLSPSGMQADYQCESGHPYSGGPAISGDGRWVVFNCAVSADLIGAYAPGHACGDTNVGCAGVYLRDRCIANGAAVPGCVPGTTLVSQTPTGAFPNSGSALYPVISGDGSRILYTSTATDIVPIDPGFPQQYHVFMFDRATSATTLLSVPGNTGDLFPAAMSISADGLRAVWSLGSRISFWADCASIAPVCGNGATELGCEDCDDGALVDGDGCDSNCRFTGCDNGVVTAGEGCDDGNTVDGDGCDSNCTPTSCGNDIKTSGEGCDDGDLVSNDGCSDTCAVEPGELTPSGKGKADCEMELMPYYQPVKVKDVPKNTVVCRDDDPSCDFGPTLGDKYCYFRVAFCANVTDPRFTCTPIDLAGVRFTKPNFEKFPPSDVDLFNGQWLYQDFASVGGDLSRVCEVGPVGRPCSGDYDCGAGGKCGKLQFNFVPPLTTQNTCTTFGRVAVPLKEKVPGVLKQNSVTLKYKAYASKDPISGKPRNVDSDSLKLICLPPTP